MCNTTYFFFFFIKWISFNHLHPIFSYFKHFGKKTEDNDLPYHTGKRWLNIVNVIFWTLKGDWHFFEWEESWSNTCFHLWTVVLIKIFINQLIQWHVFMSSVFDCKVIDSKLICNIYTTVKAFWNDLLLL